MKRSGILLIVIFIMSMHSAWAEKYISDVLWVSLRDAPADSATSIKVYKSGTRFDVVDENEVEGYLHVKTTDGVEGWIKSRYLLDEPIAAIRVNQLEKQLAQLQKENDALKGEMNSVKKNDKETVRERKRMISENQKLHTENERLKKLAAKPMELSQELDALKTENAKLKAETQNMTQKYNSVSGEIEQTWFMIGAGVLFAGIILGLIFPNLRFRRRSTWS